MSFARLAYIFSFSLTILSSCQPKKNTEQSAPTDSLLINYDVVASFPHDENAFTQGLTIYNNKIIESTGQNNSWIAEVDPGTGKQEKKIVLDSRFFGEGITILNNKIYQLTWKNKVGFIYEAKTYTKLGEFNYNTEGWGITNNNENLIMSDGSEKLYFLDTITFKVLKTIKVTEGNSPTKRLNELEYINGYIYGNVWETPLILKIDPANGKVVGKLNLTTITNEIKAMYPRADVLNGIAFDSNSKALLVTGKLWPKSFLIRLK